MNAGGHCATINSVIRRTVLLVVVLAAATACGTPVDTAKQTFPRTTITPEPPAELTAKAALGDLTTVDACSLIEPDVFAAFGTTTFVAPESMDYCHLQIAVAGGVKLDLTIGDLDTGENATATTKPLETLDRGLTLQQDDGAEFSCTQYLIFADGIRLRVDVYVYEGNNTTSLCPVVRAGSDKVVDVVTGGKVKHHDYPSRSLSALTSCDLVADSVVEALPGLSMAKKTEYPGKHMCSWASPSGGVGSARVRLLMTLGVPVSTPPSGSTTETIGGRQTLVEPTPEAGDLSFCLLSTDHVPYETSIQSDVIEQALVTVRGGKGEVEQACATARAVAAEAWPKLPVK